jgi:hypothetical protein
MIRHKWMTVFIFLLALLLVYGLPLPSGRAQSNQWTEPVNISHTPNSSWFPDLAVDSLGNIHAIWCETTHLEIGGEEEQVYYGVRSGETWSVPSDIVPPSPHINRSAIAIDTGNLLHLAFRYNTIGGPVIFYKNAPAGQARSAKTWSVPHMISLNRNSYLSDLAIDSKGVLHLVFDDRGNEESKICPGCADIFYRRSSDGGKTWSYPVNLSSSPTGSSRVQIEIDSSDVIHVVWDEGWDGLSGQGEPVFSTYISSPDGGESWSSPTSFSYPEGTNAQLSVSGDGQGRVVVVWRATSRSEIYYAWSSDNGASWSPPVVIPDIFARPWANPFDMYDMAADSGGHIHLVMVGRLSPEEDRLGVYHLEWDGTSWSSPTVIYGGVGFPEYPKIVISEGNKLHAAWFVRETLEEGDYEVWYSSSQSASPVQTPVPLPTSTPMPTATPLVTATPTATPYPTLSVHSTDLPEGLYTESDEVLRLIIALSPVILIVLLVVVIRLGWFSKLFR